MERLLNVIKQHAGGLDQGGGQPRFGIVTSVNPAAATARVTLQPEGVLSGWLPVLSYDFGNEVSPVLTWNLQSHQAERSQRRCILSAQGCPVVRGFLLARSCEAA